MGFVHSMTPNRIITSTPVMAAAAVYATPSFLITMRLIRAIPADNAILSRILFCSILRALASNQPGNSIKNRYVAINIMWSQEI